MFRSLAAVSCSSVMYCVGGVEFGLGLMANMGSSQGSVLALSSRWVPILLIILYGTIQWSAFIFNGTCIAYSNLHHLILGYGHLKINLKVYKVSIYIFFFLDFSFYFFINIFRWGNSSVPPRLGRDGTLVGHPPAMLRTRVQVQAGREMTTLIDHFLDFVSFSDF